MQHYIPNAHRMSLTCLCINSMPGLGGLRTPGHRFERHLTFEAAIGHSARVGYTGDNSPLLINDFGMGVI